MIFNNVPNCNYNCPSNSLVYGDDALMMHSLTILPGNYPFLHALQLNRYWTISCHFSELKKTGLASCSTSWMTFQSVLSYALRYLAELFKWVRWARKWVSEQWWWGENSLITKGSWISLPSLWEHVCSTSWNLASLGALLQSVTDSVSKIVRAFSM